MWHTKGTPACGDENRGGKTQNAKLGRLYNYMQELVPLQHHIKSIVN